MVTQPHAENTGVPQHEAASQDLSLPGEELEPAVDLQATSDRTAQAEDELIEGETPDAIPPQEAEISVSADSDPHLEMSEEPVEPESSDAIAAADVEASASDEAEPLETTPEGSASGASAIEVFAALDSADEPALSAPEIVTEDEFAHVVDEALESFGGILLFKMRIDEDGHEKHVAAASIGEGARRQFLLLSLPIEGGKLKVESAARSSSPLAKLAEAYVGVVEAFCAAA